MVSQESSSKKIRDLVSSSNLIARISSDNPNSVTVSTESLERTITNIILKHPELSTYPVGILSVLGSDSNHLRKLYTDWLIHYFLKDEDKNAIHNWRNPQNTSETLKLRYIGSSRQECTIDESSVFIWQLPFLLKEIETTTTTKGRPRMLVWVIYSRCKDHVGLMDKFSASVSSSILTFNDKEKEMVSTFYHSIIQDSHEDKMNFGDTAFVHIIEPKWPSNTLLDSWNQFVTDMDTIPIKPATFKGESLNITDFISFLTSGKKAVNMNLQMSNSLGKIQSPHDSRTTDVGPNESHGVQNGRNMGGAAETDSGNEMAGQETTEFGTRAAQQGAEKSSAVKSSQATFEDILKWQEIIKNLNIGICSMYDNYLCFQGKRDCNQMERLMESAYQRAKQDWQQSEINTNRFSLEMLEEHKKTIFAKIRKDNEAIIAREKEQARAVIKGVKNEYKNKLKEYIQEESSIRTRGEFEVIHRRMKKHCISTVTRSMNNSGKLNNVLHESTKLMGQSLDSHFETQMTSLNFQGVQQACKEKRRDPVQAYHEDMEKFFASGDVAIILERNDIAEWRKKHDSIVEKSLSGVEGGERDELTLILDTHWMNVVETQLGTVGVGDEYDSSTNLGIHITNHWVRLTAGNETLQRPIAFPAQVARWSWNPEIFRWGHTYGFCPPYFGYFLDFLRIRSVDDVFLQNTTVNSVLFTKHFVEQTISYELHRLLLAVPSWLDFSQRNFLRVSSKSTGFKEVVILTESSLAAFQHFCSLPLPQDHGQDSLIIVVISCSAFIRLEIFGREIENGQTIGVQLLAVVSDKWSPGVSHNGAYGWNTWPNYLNVAKQIYGVALSQLQGSREKCVRYFMVTPDASGLDNAFDPYFLTEENLMKVGGIESMAYNALASLCVSQYRACKFLNVLASVHPKSEVSNLSRQQSNIPNEQDNGSQSSMHISSLLKKCDRMEAQINDGSVQVGKLTKRIIMDAIKNARLAAEEGMFDGDEAKEIDALRNLYFD